MLLRIETSLRAMARKAGLVPMLQSAKTKLFGKKNYEEAFDLALMRELRAGDVVYDVGANIGDYTEKFAATYTTLAQKNKVELLPFFLQGVAQNDNLFYPPQYLSLNNCSTVSPYFLQPYYWPAL